MPWPASEPFPMVSILMPVMRHRGKIIEAIDRWSGQDYPREQLEFIFVSNGREPQIEALVNSRLKQPNTPRGGMVFIKTDNEMAQYAYAARYARGEWLLFTEPHCLPQLDCVSELLGTLMQRGMVGGCVQTLTTPSTHRNARLQQRISLESAAARTPENDWRKFSKRGFALRRDVYRAIGGFEAEYGSFSQWVIAARLDAQGYRVGSIPTAAVQHFNSANIHDAFRAIWEHRREMVRYMDEGSERLRPYFEGMASRQVSPPENVVRAQRQAMRWALAHGVKHSHTPAGRALAAAMLRAMGDDVFGPTAKFALRYGLARLRLACLSLTQEQAYRNYVAAASWLGAWAEASWPSSKANAHPHGTANGNNLRIVPGETSTGIFGFHARERSAGRTFRWTSPVASLLIDTPPGDYELSIHTGDLLPLDANFHVFWNGRHLSSATTDQPCFCVRADDLQHGESQVLTILSTSKVKSDARFAGALGVPLFAVEARSLAAKRRRFAA